MHKHTEDQKKQIMSQNKVIQEQVKKQSIELKRATWEEARLENQIKQEKDFQEKMKTRLTIIKKELNSKKLEVLRKRSELKNLKEEGKQIIHELEAYEEKVMPESSEKSEIISNNFPKLVSYIRHQNIHTKFKTILLNSIHMMMEKTLDNEFSNVKWKAVLSRTNNAVGVRIKFMDLSMLKSDVKNVYTPVVQKLNHMFSGAGLILRTNYEMKHGIVTELDFIFKLNTGHQLKATSLPRAIPEV